MPTNPVNIALNDVLINQAEEFIGIYDDASGRFTRVNKAGAQLLGYPSEEAFLADLDATPRLPALPPTYWEALRTEARRAGRQEVETEVSRQNGELFWGKLQLSFLEIDGRASFLVRLSEQERLHQAERDLAQSERRFEAVFSNATIGIIVCDRQGSIISANRHSQQLFGYADSELLGQKIEVLVPNAIGRQHQKLRESFNAQPSVRAMGQHSGDLQAQRKDGSVFPVEVSLSYFYEEQDLYVVSYILDITFKKNAEQALINERQRVERLNTELEQKVADRTHALLNTLEQLEQRSEELTIALAAEQELGELKSRFVSMASHEFRTPLTAVLTSATLIEKYPGGDQQDKRLKHLQRIRSSVNHLNDILEEFLSVGKIEEGKIETRPARLDMAVLLTDTVTDVQGMLKAGQSIDKQVSCQEHVWLDPSLMRKILVNLLSNAIKYSGENSVVTVRAQCSQGQLTLTVQDQGVGISDEDKEHLFERFFRARNVTNIPGTGLGLYIIAKYLELMRGTISLESKLQEGTTVTITIPYDHHSAD
ncbi:histidine kinase [Hymenobacter sp. DG25B]|uniref:sensor histidine kinase n=1 Tax=Hymenobacter sp. DG25B TaxID=1385664 RepID=UPI0005411F3B|nr:PAS domain-containing sensor histidine kinase [Hymenobacter sp. DG25B]AIZ63696.1 histidine kinase [Hymenobacter sp. DG25B]